MSLAAPGQLVDRYPTAFLPDTSGRHRRRVGGISRQRVAKLTPAANQAIQLGQVGPYLRLQALIHRSRLALLAASPGSSCTLPALTLRTVRLDHSRASMLTFVPQVVRLQDHYITGVADSLQNKVAGVLAVLAVCW